jgi:hypothetical protein
MSYTFGKNFINAIGKIFEIFPNVDYVYPSKNAFAEDAARLRGDAKKIGNDMKKSLKPYVQ